MKIGVFGGTFNPIHNSHIYLAEEFLKSLELDKVLFIPTFLPPHKTASNLASSQDRLNMCKLAIEGKPYFSVDEFEIDRKGKSYTYQTLEYLTDKYKGASFYLLMGSDMYLTMEKWKNPERIYRLATLCAIAREKDEYDQLNLYKKEIDKKGAKSIILEVAPKPMSSTEIRNRVGEGKTLDGLVPASVEQYIKQNRLYL